MQLNLRQFSSKFSLEDVDEVSVPVDEEGEPTEEPSPIPQGTVDHPTQEPWYETYRSDMEMVTEVVPIKDVDIYQHTVPYLETFKPIPYCPVYIHKDPEGHMVAMAYVTGQIKDVHEYINLTDILEIAESEDRIYIFIDSPGGYVATGAAVASCIDTCKGTVTCIARGLCASAGSLIWSAGHHQVAMPFANFMYHMSSHGDMGNSESIRSRAEAQVTYVKKCLLAVAVEKGHVTEEELTKICVGKDNVFISSQEMNKRINDMEVK